MMLYHPTLNETLQALKDFAIDRPEPCPPHIFDRIRQQTSELESFGETLKLIYDVPVARGGKQTIGPKLAQIAAAGLNVFSRSGFLDMGKVDQNGDRPSERMRMALLRDAGEPEAGTPWPKPEEDPVRRPLPKDQETPTPPAA